MNDLSLYRIEEELQALLDSVETCPEELQGELAARIAEYIGAEAGKVDNIGRVLSTLDALQKHAKNEIERLQTRRQAAENNATRLAAYVLDIIRQREGKPLKGHSFTLYTGHTDALIIDDPDAVPAEWKRTTVSVDIPKGPLKDAIRNGETVPGAHIERREYLAKR